MAFQSTHPMRGATLNGANSTIITITFQSTHPMRGATVAYIRVSTLEQFQSTHPMRGATLRRTFNRQSWTISIHAPHAGCDRTACIPLYGTHDFNPRTPCGVRLPRRTRKRYDLHFNPRTPCGVRPFNWGGIWTDENFNPRTPCGVRHVIDIGLYTQKDISIHAPHAGCD